MPASTEAPASLQLPGTGVRIVVQRTFIEVVEESGVWQMGAVARRALSVPALPIRGDEMPQDAQEAREGEPERPDHSTGVPEQGQVARGPAGQEPKTTVAIRSIPPHLTRDQLVQYLDALGFAGRYDFLYLPIDFAKRQNFGYAFVNLTSPEQAQRIFAELGGAGWGEHGQGHAVVGWSLTQGLELHVERYRNSPVMHEGMPDECKPIVLEGGVRASFPLPTKKVQRLRRLRTRCGSRGRAVSSSGLDAMFGTEARQEEAAPVAPAGPCVLLPGLISAPSDDSEGTAAILASPLLAGLTGAMGECSARATEPPGKRTAWADLWDDDLVDDGCSECSTQAAGYFSGTLSSASDVSSVSSDGLAARRRGRGGSMLAQGLTASLQE